MDPIIPPPNDAFSGESTTPPLPPLSTSSSPWWRRGKTVALVTIGVLLVSGGAVAWWWAKKPLDAETILFKYIQQAPTIKSFHSVYQLSLAVAGEQRSGIESVRMIGVGDIDLSDNSDPSVSLIHEATIQFAPSSATASLGFTNASVGLELRSRQKKQYLQFTRLPTLGFFSLTPLINRWILLPATQSTGADTIEIEKFFETLRRTFSTADLFRSPEFVSVEDVEGIGTYHLKVGLNEQQLREIQKSLENAGNNNPNALRVLSGAFSAIADARADLWIIKDDFSLRKAIFPIQYSDAQSGIRVTGSFEQTLSAINSPVTITAPADAKPFEEVIADVLGPMAGSFGNALPAGLSASLGVGKLNGLSRSASPAAPDADFDGLNDEQEAQSNTDPFNSDTDHDNVIDGDEVNAYQTNPLKADTDADGLTDAEEIFRWKTNPLNRDTDGDGYTDGQEVKNGYNPAGEGKMTPQQLQLRGQFSPP